MEFGVALFGAIMSTTLPKIVKLMSSNTAFPSEEVESINDTFGFMQAAIRDIQNSSIGKYATAVQVVGVAKLCFLAAEIEDCLDGLKAGKIDPDKFSAKLKKLEVSVERNNKRVTEFAAMVQSLKAAKEATSTSAPGQHSRSAVHGRPVPRRIEELLDDNTDQSMPCNLNCLLYLCLFPCNHHVERNPLIRQLLVEGLVTAAPDDRRSLQDVAAEYLDILLAKEIIQQPIQERNSGKVKRYETPEDILNYITYQSLSTNFMTFCDHMEQRAPDVRRLSVRPGSAVSQRQLIVPSGFSRVRSLAVFPDAEPAVSYEAVLDFERYEVLRLLDLKKCDAVDQNHLLAIFDHLLMLKYLRLGDSIGEVPKQVEELKMLETLDLGRTAPVAVYSEILELPHLKHLLGKLDLCTKDVWGPRKGKLKKFLLDGTDNGSQLETLSGFVTGRKQGFAMLMSHMKRLKKVKIWCDSTPNKANLKILKEGIEMFISEGSGRSLCIDFLNCSKELLEPLEVLDVTSAAPRRGAFWRAPRRPAVSPGPGSIVSLKLRGELTEFPKSVARMTGIKQMCLKSTKLRGDKIMAGLSNLSNLEYLKLVEEELCPLKVISGKFPNLKQIFLVGIINLGITVEDGALPELVSLYLNCETLGTYTAPPPPNPQPSSTAERVTLAANVKINHMAQLEKIVLHSALSGNAVDWETAAQMHPKTVKPVVSFLPS